MNSYRTDTWLWEAQVNALKSELEAQAAEIERLLAANRDVMLHWDVLRADYERLRAALEEVRVLVFGANHSEARYPLARAALEGRDE